MKKKRLNNPSENSLSTYGGEYYNEITIDDLYNNKVAIAQLINEHKRGETELKKLNEKNSELIYSLARLKGNPLIAIASSIFNILGTLICSIGVSLLDRNGILSIAFIVLGGIVVIIANSLNILYLYVPDLFSKYINWR